MEEPPDLHAFPAQRLGSFLRAMADPEGQGRIPPEHEKTIAKIEQSLAQTREDEENG